MGVLDVGMMDGTAPEGAGELRSGVRQGGQQQCLHQLAYCVIQNKSMKEWEGTRSVVLGRGDRMKIPHKNVIKRLMAYIEPGF